MTEAKLLLCEDVNVIVASTPKLELEAWWTLDMVLIRPSNSQTDELESTGSWTVAGDEWRFSRATGLLVGACLQMPEMHEDWPTAWNACGHGDKLTQSTIKMQQPRPFMINGTDISYFEPNGQRLAGIYKPAHPDANMNYVSIAQYLDLLFVDGAYCGWMLSYPVERIFAPSLGGRVRNCASTNKIIIDYLKLTDSRNFWHSEPRRISTLTQLSSLQKKIMQATDHAPHLIVLVQKIDRILRAWNVA